MLKKLNEMSIGESGKIVSVGGEGRVRRRLFDMGVTPGAQLTVVKFAPLGDPMEIVLRGYTLTLRKSEAINVGVETA